MEEEPIVRALDHDPALIAKIWDKTKLKGLEDVPGWVLCLAVVGAATGMAWAAWALWPLMFGPVWSP